MAGGSKKGFPYEREISRKLSSWLTKGERDDILWRTEGSGGRSTIAGKKGKKLPNSYGDIGVKDPNSKEAREFINKVLLECKRGYTKDVDILDLLDKKKGIPQVLKWWDKAEKERIECNRIYTWIILKRNMRKDVIILQNNMWDVFDINYIHIVKDKYNLIIFELDEFLTEYKPKYIIG